MLVIGRFGTRRAELMGRMAARSLYPHLETWAAAGRAWGEQQGACWVRKEEALLQLLPPEEEDLEQEPQQQRLLALALAALRSSGCVLIGGGAGGCA